MTTAPDTDGVACFIKAVRQHFTMPKKTPEEERDWVRSMAYILRDYVSSELALAAETIINTRELRFFPLPSDCLKACAHARTILKTRTGAAALPAVWPPIEKAPEPGMLIWRKRDEEWRKAEARRKAAW